jgi:hypothetical protein
MSATIDRVQPIPVTFTGEQWGAVLQVLSNGPYNVVAPLIAGIQQQCMRYAQAPLPEHVPMRPPGGANGEDHPG